MRVLDLRQDRDTQRILAMDIGVPNRKSEFRPRDQAPAWSRLSSKLCFVEQRRLALSISVFSSKEAEWLARGSRLARGRSEASGIGVPKLELGIEFQSFPAGGNRHSTFHQDSSKKSSSSDSHETNGRIFRTVRSSQ